MKQNMEKKFKIEKHQTGYKSCLHCGRVFCFSKFFCSSHCRHLQRHRDGGRHMQQLETGGDRLLRLQLRPAGDPTVVRSEQYLDTPRRHAQLQVGGTKKINTQAHEHTVQLVIINCIFSSKINQQDLPT